MDEVLALDLGPGVELFGYADDVLVLARTATAAEEAQLAKATRDIVSKMGWA